MYFIYIFCKFFSNKQQSERTAKIFIYDCHFVFFAFHPLTHVWLRFIVTWSFNDSLWYKIHFADGDSCAITFKIHLGKMARAVVIQYFKFIAFVDKVQLRVFSSIHCTFVELVVVFRKSDKLKYHCTNNIVGFKLKSNVQIWTF